MASRHVDENVINITAR